MHYYVFFMLHHFKLSVNSTWNVTHWLHKPLPFARYHKYTLKSIAIFLMGGFRPDSSSVLLVE